MTKNKTPFGISKGWLIILLILAFFLAATSGPLKMPKLWETKTTYNKY